MQKQELVVILDFGGQYNQLIARRVRECNVYCEIKPYTTPLEEIKALHPKGIIFTGGPQSVYAAGSPHADTGVPEPGVPESFKVLIKELQSLGLDIKVLSENNEEIVIGELTDDDDVRELGVNIAGYEDAPGGMLGDDDVDDFNFGDDDGEDDDDSYEEDEHDEFDGFTFEDADGNYEE